MINQAHYLTLIQKINESLQKQGHKANWEPSTLGGHTFQSPRLGVRRAQELLKVVNKHIARTPGLIGLVFSREKQPNHDETAHIQRKVDEIVNNELRNLATEIKDPKIRGKLHNIRRRLGMISSGTHYFWLREDQSKAIRQQRQQRSEKIRE